MTTDETPAAECPKGSACNWKKSLGPIMGVVFWMIMGAFLFNALTNMPPKQGLRITNTGSQSVDIRKLARWSWQEEEWTLQPGETFFANFADAEHYRITRSDQAPPKPGTTPPASPPLSRSEMWGSAVNFPADGSANVMLRHVDRTAEVRVNEAGKIEFEFTDL